MKIRLGGGTSHLRLALGRAVVTDHQPTYYFLTSSLTPTSVWWFAKRITFSPALRDLDASSQYLVRGRGRWAKGRVRVPAPARAPGLELGLGLGLGLGLSQRGANPEL